MPHLVRILPLLTLMSLPVNLIAGQDAMHPARIVPPPQEAIVVFNGENAEGFTDMNGKPISWKVENGELHVGGNDVMTKAEFGSAQIHVEFSLPTNDKGHGNSGFYIHHTFEVQVLDSSLEKPYASPAQQCGSLYQTYPPLVNVCTPPETWQSYDILFQAAQLDDQGKIHRPARITVIHNGVVVQDNRELKEGTGAGKNRKIVERGPLRIQAHGAPVKLRNLWILPIADVTEETAEPDRDSPDKKAFAKRVSPGFWNPDRQFCTAPEDATVLFQGELNEQWILPPENNRKITAKEHSFVLQQGDLRYGKSLEDVQFHLEWKSRGYAPISIRKGEQVYLLTPPDDGSQAERWRTLDLIWHSPSENDPGNVTILLDGVVITNHRKLAPEWSIQGTQTEPHLVLSPGEGTEYRNLWIRPVKPAN